jgi:transposase-like protein
VIEGSNGCSDVAAHERLLRRGRDASRKAMFDEIRALYEAGSPVTEIARKLGLGPRRVYRWVRRIDLPEPSAMAPKACTPAYFGAFLARSWAEGTRISVIEATPARIVTWRASSLRGAAAAPPQEKRVSGLRRTRKLQHRRTCGPWTR